MGVFAAEIKKEDRVIANPPGILFRPDARLSLATFLVLFLLLCLFLRWHRVFPPDVSPLDFGPLG